VMMSMTSLLMALGMFLTQLFVSNVGGVDEVGFYHAGVVIINSYVGMIFNAMSTDYYPRLAAIADDVTKLRETVLHQAVIALLLITPVVILFIIFAEIVVVLLYTKEFIPVVGFLIWAILGTVFKAVSFSMGYIFIAKGDAKIFMKTALFFNVLLVILNIVGYYYGGLAGMGISFLIYYFVHFLLISVITKQAYNFYFPKTFYGMFLSCILLVGVAFGFSKFEDVWIKHTGLLVVLLLSAGVSLYLLNKKMDLKGVIKTWMHKRKK